MCVCVCACKKVLCCVGRGRCNPVFPVTTCLVFARRLGRESAIMSQRGEGRKEKNREGEKRRMHFLG